MYEEKQHKKRPRRATTDLLRLAHAQPPRVEPVWIRLDHEALGGEEGLVDLVNVLDERQYLAELVERLGLGLYRVRVRGRVRGRGRGGGRGRGRLRLRVRVTSSSVAASPVMKVFREGTAFTAPQKTVLVHQ